MKSHLALGLFALYVVTVSLCRLLSDRLPPRLSALQRIWGRRLGLLLHFVAHVALPLVIGVVFIGQGILHFPGETGRAILAPIHHRHSLPHLYPRPATPLPQPAEVLSNGEIALLLAPPASYRRPKTERIYGPFLNAEMLPP